MTDEWHYRQVPFKFQLGDFSLGGVSLPMHARKVHLRDALHQIDCAQPPVDKSPPEVDGYVIRAASVSIPQPVLTKTGNYLRYIPSQYSHFYIDLASSFDQYKAKFSSKTRSTITRKVAKFSQHCGGKLDCREYKRPDHIREFFRQARLVSTRTYQERLLDAGLPASEEFIQRAIDLASADCLRAYVLFDNDRPVSYLYCPVDGDTLLYSYLGYDPDYLKHSVGTVLQWLALESLFVERKFQYFDFTEGQSDHKRLFATHSVLSADIFFINATMYNGLLIKLHWHFARFSNAIGQFLERNGLKTRVRKWVRLHMGN